MDKGFTLHKMLYYRCMAVKASIHADPRAFREQFRKARFPQISLRPL
jgi:hypothetical protein